VYGWRYEDYRAKYDELWPQGWRLKLLTIVQPQSSRTRTPGDVVNLLPVDMTNEYEGARLPGSSHLCGGGTARDVLPGVESFPHFLTVLGGGQAMPSWTEMLGDGPIGSKEALGMTR
jgi:hypothetical protein